MNAREAAPYCYLVTHPASLGCVFIDQSPRPEVSWIASFSLSLSLSVLSPALLCSALGGACLPAETPRDGSL